VSIVLDLIEAEKESDEILSVEELRIEYRRIINSGELDFDRLLFLGRAFEEFDLVEEALHCYSRIIGLDGGQVEALSRRGNVTFGLFVARDVDGNERELVRWAVSDFEKAVQFSGNDPAYIRMLALGLLMLGNYDRSRKLCESTLGDMSDALGGGTVWDLLYVLGYSQFFLGFTDSALLTFRRLAEGPGVSEEGWFGQAVCLWKLGLGVEVAAARKNLSEPLNDRLSALLETGMENYLTVARALL